ncbi:MAG: ester cyclase [Tabrizicola sp.]|jgi:steroid delta-isomerase-like uncharacterized protein|nr:ester cyclase [Tabrizicola sp.]
MNEATSIRTKAALATDFDIIGAREAYLKAFRSRDADALGALFAPAAIRVNPGTPDAIGRTEIRDVMARHFETFGNQSIADTYRFIQDRCMIAVWTWHATQDADYLGVPASGKQVGVMGASVFWFGEDGKIIKECTYWDPYGVLKQLGAGAEPGREIPPHATAPEIFVAGRTDAEAANIRHLRTYHSYLLGGQLQPWLDYMTDDIAWDDQMAPGLAVGKKHSASDFAMLRSAFGDPEIKSVNVWGNNQFVIHQGIFTAKHKGELMGIPASNRFVIVDNIDVISFTPDGKIDKGWSFGNSIEMGYQLGVGAKQAQ